LDTDRWEEALSMASGKIRQETFEEGQGKESGFKLSRNQTIG
jgi:hypothetical protein